MDSTSSNSNGNIWSGTALPPPSSHGGTPFSQLKLDELRVEEVANFFNLQEHLLFCRVAPEEFLSKAMKQWTFGLPSTAPHLSLIASRFDALAKWTASCIVSQSKLRHRIAVVKFLIDVGREMLKNRNYNSLKAMLTGFEMHCVFRLRSTWDGVGASHSRRLKRLRRDYELR